MKVFVAVSYSSQVDYQSGLVFPDYKAWLELELSAIEALGHEVFCALRADNYAINSDDPAAAYTLDEHEIKNCDIFLAYVTDKASVGVQTELGYALALGKKVIIAHDPETELAYFNRAIILAGQATEAIYPISSQPDLFS